MAAPKGRQLSQQLGLDVRQSRYSDDGTWYENPTDFPCAFHDREGYVIASSPEHWQRLQAKPADGGPSFVVTKKTHVDGVGIRRLPGYVRHRSSQEIARTAPDSPPGDDGVAPPEYEPEDLQDYTIQSIISDGCFLEQSRLEEILNRLKDKKNLILQGPPGTGKTWLAKRLAFALVGSRSEVRVRPFQFHPNLSYEDFVRGWRPSVNGLALVDGPFLKAINDSRDDPSNLYVVVIEEINRGNPAQIFGEMLTLLEVDRRNPEDALALSYSKSYSERVYVPPNLYVIGTMNVADRSLALVDFALRRRFAFVDLEPVFGERWRNWVSEKCQIDRAFLEKVEERIRSLNRTITEDNTLGPQFRVGHSVVTPVGDITAGDPQKWFKQVVETEIGPLLGEYWFDDPDKARAESEKLLQGLVP